MWYEPDVDQPGLTPLIRLLRAAYSGERAAALAYRGHWRSMASPAERAQIRAIEDDEWRHRARVGEMLSALGAAPDRFSELRAAAMGHTLGVLCHVSGRLLPLLGAGMLEAKNIREYETAARLAHRCGREEWVDELLEMAEVEWDHEAAFRALVMGHALGRRLSLWPCPPPRDSIREAFTHEMLPAEGARMGLPEAS